MWRLFVVAGVFAAGTAGAAPACPAELVGNPEQPADATHLKVKIGGAELLVPLVPAGRLSTVALRTWQWRAGAILLSYTAGDRHGPSGSEALYEVSCGGAPALKELVRIPGADFGHAVLTADGKTLYFSGPDGIATLDLPSRKIRHITTAPALAHCDTNDTKRARDVVGEFQEGGKRLAFERGGPCGFEGDWQSAAYSLDGIGKGKKPIVRRPNPIASLAADAGGALFLSDGTCDGAASHAAIWTSVDQGGNWRRLPIKMRLPQPVKRILTSAKQPGQLAVWTDGCGSEAHTEPGWVYLTLDGGVTWTPIKAPPEIPSHEGVPDSEQDPLMGVQLVGGELQRLQIFGNVVDQVQNGRDLLPRWESLDGGKSWKKLPAAPAPVAAPAAVTTAAATFRITPEGVMREAAGARPVRVFPPLAAPPR